MGLHSINGRERSLLLVGQTHVQKQMQNKESYSCHILQKVMSLKTIRMAAWNELHWISSDLLCKGDISHWAEVLLLRTSTKMSTVS